MFVCEYKMNDLNFTFIVTKYVMNTCGRMFFEKGEEKLSFCAKLKIGVKEVVLLK